MTWHITAYSWEEMSIAIYDDLIVEWIALCAVWCWKMSLVDQLQYAGFIQTVRMEMNPLVEVTVYGAYVIALLACCNLKGHVRTCSTLEARKIICYFRFHFNRREENYWLTLNVHPEDGSSKFVRSYYYQPTALHDVTSPKKISLENYGFAFLCLRIIRWKASESQLTL
jgi:hypothetical protein